jgi:hypothetical protein
MTLEIPGEGIIVPIPRPAGGPFLRKQMTNETHQTRDSLRHAVAAVMKKRHIPLPRKACEEISGCGLNHHD